MKKLVKCRKDCNCDYCGETIHAGNKYLLVKDRVPKYDKDDTQIGIEYLTHRLHHEPLCEELQFKVGRVVQSKDGIHLGKIKFVHKEDFVDVVWGLNHVKDWKNFAAEKVLMDEIDVVTI